MFITAIILLYDTIILYLII